ncbi:guanylate-binding protein 4-like [Hyperolius riggenbachi]|uniref:guanylate-binding protein 4-like n=1 Tax=Hyperolius riggenbachi TaxID=752182 RepID=UPI0035A37D64
MKNSVCLIQNVEKLVVNQEAIEILNAINQPIVSVAVVGMYRSGKSYLMNKLAGSLTAFEMGSEVGAKTKGIWMWCMPHPMDENQTLLLLDTEGLGDIAKGDDKNDKKLLALAILLSSALVYNSKGTIDQDALNTLKSVSELTELIKVKHSQGKKNDEGNFSRYFPTFVWVVRDFHLGLQLEGKRISEDEYLEKALTPKFPANTSSEEEYNKLRECLRLYFGTRKCFVFDYPTSNTDNLKILDSIPEKDLNTKFLDQCRKFREYILKNVKEKKVRDVSTLTGTAFAELARIYTEAMNTSRITCLEDAVSSLSERENAAAIKEAIQFYEEMMKKVGMPTDTMERFVEISNKYEAEAEKKFRQRSFRDEKEQFLEKFVQSMAKKKKELMSMYENKTREKCKAVIKEHAANFEKALREKAYLVPGGYERFKQDLKSVEEKYNMECGKGVMAEEVLMEYINSKHVLELTILKTDKALDKIEKRKKEEHSRQEKKEGEERKRREEEAWKKKRLEEENAHLQETIQKLKKQIEEERKMTEKKLENLIREKQREMHLYMEQKLQQQAEDFQAQIDELKKEKIIEKDKEKEKEKNPQWEKNLFSRLKRFAQ